MLSIKKSASIPRQWCMAVAVLTKMQSEVVFVSTH